jgi:hypothetical protein
MPGMRSPISAHTATRLLLAVALAATVPAGRAAAQTGDASVTLSQCQKITGAAERLACYDRLSRSPPPAPAPAASPYGPVPAHNFGLPPASTQTTPQLFGSEQLPAHRQQAPALTRIAAKVVSFTAGPSGRFTVELDNGQVWKQIEGDESFARYDKRTTRTALISRGMLGSYDLVFNDRNATFKVVRVR